MAGLLLAAGCIRPGPGSGTKTEAGQSSSLRSATGIRATALESAIWAKAIPQAIATCTWAMKRIGPLPKQGAELMLSSSGGWAKTFNMVARIA